MCLYSVYDANRLAVFKMGPKLRLHRTDRSFSVSAARRVTSLAGISNHQFAFTQAIRPQSMWGYAIKSR